MGRSDFKDAMMNYFRSIDWKNVEMHVVVGIVLAFFLITIFGFIGAFLNAIFWFVREVYQDFQKGHRWPSIWPLRRSNQKDIEALFPIVLGFVTLILMG